MAEQMKTFHILYEGTAGVRLDSTGMGVGGEFPRDWIDVYQEGRGVIVSMGAADGTIITHKIENVAATSLAFGLLRAGLDYGLRKRIHQIFDLITGEHPRG